MGYFEGLASGSLKKDANGRTVFYPFGVLGKGSILPDELAEHRVRQFMVRYYKICFAVSTGLMVFGYRLWLLALLPVFVAWFIFSTKSLVSGFPFSDSKLTFKEASANSAKAQNTTTLWVLLVCSVVFVLGGIFISTSAHELKQQLIGFFSVAFFGFASVAIAYMLWAKRA